MSLKGIFPYVLLILSSLGALAYEYTPADTANVYFRLGYRQVDPTFADNKAALERFVNSIKEAKAEDDVHHIVVRTSASPDGGFDANIRLSQNRSEEMVKYLVKEAEIDQSLIESSSEGIAWAELRRLVEETPAVPMREQVLDIIDNYPERKFDSTGNVVGSRKQALMALGGAVPYNWMLKNLFPQLRSAMVISLYRTSYMEAEDRAREEAARKAAEEAARNAQQAQPQPAPVEEVTEVVEVAEEVKTSDANNVAVDGTAVAGLPGKNFYMDIRSNMLYDALALPNIGVDFYLGKNFSIGGNWMYGWWKTDRRSRYWRAYGGELNGRWWFGKAARSKPLTGHHVGIYGQVYTYDFEWGGQGEMGGKPGDNMWNRCFWAAGVEYGFSLPVARRINIDFTLGLGYTEGTYYKYHPEDGHYVWESTHKRHYVGPTKLEVAFVWLIGNGNANAKYKKGGKK